MQTWRDTVMTKEQRNEVYDNGNFETVGDERLAFCQAQAERTGDIAFKAGQKEAEKQNLKRYAGMYDKGWYDAKQYYHIQRT